MDDLAPDSCRQRLGSEGYPEKQIDDDEIKRYLSELSDIIGMYKLLEPVTHLSPTFGWAGWIHWETSGAHFYAWDTPRLFFSVDIYTCKAFDPHKAAEFTNNFFAASRIVYKEF